jgi:hypothetical protein
MMSSSNPSLQSARLTVLHGAAMLPQRPESQAVSRYGVGVRHDRIIWFGSVPSPTVLWSATMNRYRWNPVSRW